MVTADRFRRVRAAMPSGTQDRCSSGSCSGLNGLYCGSDDVNGDDVNGLYQCSNGSPVTATHCVNGCVVEPPGTNDHCA
jgi:hypothetical protein